MEQSEKKQSTKQLLVFLGITFLITYLYEFLFVGNLSKLPALAPYTTYFVAGAMFLPAIGMLLTRLITHEGFKNLFVAPKFKGHIRFYLAAWILPWVAIILGAVLYFVVFPQSFDPNMGAIAQSYAAQGMDFDADAMRIMIISQILMSLLLSPILNIITCAGEEWGWRGYMMPKLTERFKFLPACLIGGLIWGLWHMPLTIMGHNYGLGYAGYPFTGIAAMCVFCIVVGTFLTYVSLKTGSFWPAAIAHGMLNGIAAVGIYFTAADKAPNPFVGPAATGILGGAGLIVLALVCLLLWNKKPKAHTVEAPEISE
ncbi:MAG: type II CAAX endopeptidase family protein [Oscillospiraceae bacterium]